jgi:hypothetical protein
MRGEERGNHSRKFHFIGYASKPSWFCSPACPTHGRGKMEPTHAILTSSAVYLIIVIFIKARSCSTGASELGEVRRVSRKEEKRVGAQQPHTICAVFLHHTCTDVRTTRKRRCNVRVSNFSVLKEIQSFQGTAYTRPIQLAARRPYQARRTFSNGPTVTIILD